MSGKLRRTGKKRKISKQKNNQGKYVKKMQKKRRRKWRNLRKKKSK